MFFAVITKNLKWEILTKNLVTFKIWDGMKNFNIMGVQNHWVAPRSAQPYILPRSIK